MNPKLYRQFDEMLDECYPEVEIIGLKYPASIAAKRVDPVNYEQCFLNWLDTISTEDLNDFEEHA